MARVHQFVPAVAPSDGVTGGVLLTQALLRELGHDSQAYTSYAPEGMPVVPLDQFRDEQCDLLLVHHSMGHELEPWLKRRRGPQALVYHNITPAEFFADDSAERHYAKLGRAQLARWADRYPRALAMSSYNGRELRALGYRDIEVIPLVVGHDRLLGLEPVEPDGASGLLSRAFALCVGRIAENKRQHLLLEALWYLKRLLPDAAPRLVIAGGTTSAGYAAQLRRRSEQLGLAGEVHFVGKCSDAELRWYYEHAAQLWHASAHEGFCVPLVEACAFDLPAIAIASSTIADTLGPAGLVLKEHEPAAFAAASYQALQSEVLRERLQAAARANLARYDRATLKAQLQTWVNTALGEEAGKR